MPHPHLFLPDRSAGGCHVPLTIVQIHTFPYQPVPSPCRKTRAPEHIKRSLTLPTVSLLYALPESGSPEQWYRGFAVVCPSSHLLLESGTKFSGLCMEYGKTHIVQYADSITIFCLKQPLQPSTSISDKFKQKFLFMTWMRNVPYVTWKVMSFKKADFNPKTAILRLKLAQIMINSFVKSKSCHGPIFHAHNHNR